MGRDVRERGREGRGKKERRRRREKEVHFLGQFLPTPLTCFAEDHCA